MTVEGESAPTHRATAGFGARPSIPRIALIFIFAQISPPEAPHPSAPARFDPKDHRK
jgi:hypothetical protein